MATQGEVEAETRLMQSRSRTDFRYAEYLMIDRLSHDLPLLYTGETYPKNNKKVFTKDNSHTREYLGLERYLREGRIIGYQYNIDDNVQRGFYIVKVANKIIPIADQPFIGGRDIRFRAESPKS